MAGILKPVRRYAVLGKPVAWAVVFALDFAEHIVICDLLDTTGRVLAVDRYFRQDGGDCPFSLPTQRERSLLEMR